jgi:hypothetical protein
VQRQEKWSADLDDDLKHVAERLQDFTSASHVFARKSAALSEALLNFSDVETRDPTAASSSPRKRAASGLFRRRASSTVDGEADAKEDEPEEKGGNDEGKREDKRSHVTLKLAMGLMGGMVAVCVFFVLTACFFSLFPFSLLGCYCEPVAHHRV